MARPLKKMGTKHEDICVSHVNQKVTSAEEHFNNQGDRMACSLIPASLFLQPLLSLPSGLIDKMAIVTGMQVISGTRNMGFRSQRRTWLRLLLNVQSTSSRDQQ